MPTAIPTLRAPVSSFITAVVGKRSPYVQYTGANEYTAQGQLPGRVTHNTYPYSQVLNSPSELSILRMSITCSRGASLTL